jgi:hypothetical protein
VSLAASKESMALAEWRPRADVMRAIGKPTADVENRPADWQSDALAVARNRRLFLVDDLPKTAAA